MGAADGLPHRRGLGRQRPAECGALLLTNLRSMEIATDTLGNQYLFAVGDDDTLQSFEIGTDGSLTVAINALQSVSKPHSFLGIDQGGQVAVIRTRGNAYGHMVLRGGERFLHGEDLPCVRGWRSGRVACAC